jgi:hypothetical protein
MLFSTSFAKNDGEIGPHEQPPLNAVIRSWSGTSSINAFMPGGGRPPVIVTRAPPARATLRQVATFERSFVPILPSIIVVNSQPGRQDGRPTLGQVAIFRGSALG